MPERGARRVKRRHDNQGNDEHDTMAGRESFESFYRRELARPLAGLETRRRGVLGWWIATLATVAVGVLVLALGGAERAPLVVGALVVVVIVLAVVGSSRQMAFRHAFKGEILPKVVRHFSPHLRYAPEGGIDRGRFQHGRLFPSRIDRYKAEDLVSGRLDKTEFAVSEVHAQYKTTTRKPKGGTRTTWHTIFKGLYFTGDFNKEFHGRTVVLPDTMERAFGFLGKAMQGMNFTRGELIKLEDPVFERAFVVYGDDQVEARYILTPALMERMMTLKQKAGGRVYFSFAGSQVHVAIPSTRNHFEPRVFRSVEDAAMIREYFGDLALVTGIVEDLNLNTRIWSKA